MLFCLVSYNTVSVAVADKAKSEYSNVILNIVKVRAQHI